MGYLFILTLLAVAFGVGRFYWTRAQAIRNNLSRVDVFGGLVRIVFWEPNEGMVFLSDKAVTEVVKADPRAGGSRVLLPFLGQSACGPVPSRRVLTRLSRPGVKTRESLPLDISLAVEWQVTDCEKYLFETDEVRAGGSVKDIEIRSEGRDFHGKQATQFRIAWFIADAMRLLVSRASAAEVISSEASRSLLAEEEQARTNATNSVTLADHIRQLVTQRLNEVDLGVSLRSVMVEDVSFPRTLQEKIVGAREAMHQGQITGTELNALANSLGVSQVRLERVLKELPESMAINVPGVAGIGLGGAGFGENPLLAQLATSLRYDDSDPGQDGPANGNRRRKPEGVSDSVNPVG